MSLKLKLSSTICAFMLILGLSIMGVFASPSAIVNLGGSIIFTAIGVNAKVTGSVADYGNDTFTQDIFSGVDFTAKLTEQGTLVIEAKTKDAVKICEYKAIN